MAINKIPSFLFITLKLVYTLWKCLMLAIVYYFQNEK